MTLWMSSCRAGSEPLRWTVRFAVGCSLLLTIGLTADLRAEPKTAAVVSEKDAPIERVRWVELTSLAVAGPTQVMTYLRPGEVSVVPTIPLGPAYACTGGEDLGVSCRAIEIEATAAGEREPLVLDFEDGLAVTGRFVADSQSIVGARVAIVPAGLGFQLPFTLPIELLAEIGLRRSVVTDQSGRFVTPELAPGRYFLEAVLPGGEIHRSDTWEIAAERLLAGGPFSLGRIDIDPGLPLEIEVVDRRSIAVSGVEVLAHQGRTPVDVATFQGITDRHGRVLLSGIDPLRPVSVRCRAEGFASIDAELGLGSTFHRFELESLATISARVMDRDGVPLSAAWATARLRSDGHEVVAEQAVATDGKLVLSISGDGPGYLTVAAPGHEVRDVEFQLAADEDLDLGTITLLPGRRISAVVVDGDSGEGLAGVAVHSVQPRGAVAAMTDEAGRFVVDIDPRTTLELLFEFESYVPHRERFEPDRLRAEDLGEFELELGGRLRVVVTDAEGTRPCVGCPIEIAPHHQSLVTDGRGEVASGPLAAGLYRVGRPRVTHLGSTVIVDEDAESHWAYVRAGVLSTVELGQRQRSTEVIFDPPLRSKTESEPTLSARTPWRTERFFANADGSFEIGQGNEETLELFAHFYEAGGYETVVRQLRLPAGSENQRVVHEPPSGGLGGRLRSASDPLAGVDIRVLSLVDNSLVATSKSDAEGGFLIPNLARGTYTVYVGDRPLRFVSVNDREIIQLGTHELLAGGY